MTTFLGKSCSFCLPRVPFVSCRRFVCLVISLLVLRAGYGIWLYQFLMIAYLFTLQTTSTQWTSFLSAAPMGPGFWSVFAVRSKGSQGPKLSSCEYRRLWSDWADAQADPSLRWAHVVGFVEHGGYPILSYYQCQQTRSVHDEYSWYLSRQTSISIHPAFLRNKSIAYLENKYWTDRWHSACKSEFFSLPEAATTVTVHI